MSILNSIIYTLSQRFYSLLIRVLFFQHVCTCGYSCLSHLWSTDNITVINYGEATIEDHTLITVYDRTNKVTVYKYNSSKQLLSKTDANGSVTAYEYDTAGNLTKQTYGLGNYNYQRVCS